MSEREIMTDEQFEKLTEKLTEALQPREVFNTEQAAAYLVMSRQNLELLRLKGGGPRYAKLGRSVRYRRAALDEWLAQHEQNHTAEGA